MATKDYKFGTGKHGARAVQADDPNTGEQAVGIGNLRVLILPDGDFWFAQGLEIDYGVQGKSLEDAKSKFEDGLAATIQLHLQQYGNIVKLLKVAGPEIWKEAIENSQSIEEFTQVSFHSITPENATLIPYGNIDYYAPKAA